MNDQNDVKIGLFRFIAEVYNAWDSVVGKFLNLLSILSSIATGLLLADVLKIPDRNIEISVAAVTLLFPAIFWFLAIFKVWKKQKQDLLQHESNKVTFEIYPEVKALKLSKYKSLISKRIEKYIRDKEDAPEPATKSDYQGWINTLEDYNKTLNDYEKVLESSLLIDLILETDKTENNIDVFVTVTGGRFVELSEIPFPEYPISATKNLMPSSNIGMTTHGDAPYRTNTEVSDNNASCNLKCIKQGQKVTFMNELVLIFDEDEVTLNISINSNNSDGNIEKEVRLNLKSRTEGIDLMDFDFFDYLAGDYN
jgi:hypothetical protein